MNYYHLILPNGRKIQYQKKSPNSQVTISKMIHTVLKNQKSPNEVGSDPEVFNRGTKCNGDSLLVENEMYSIISPEMYNQTRPICIKYNSIPLKMNVVNKTSIMNLKSIIADKIKIKMEYIEKLEYNDFELEDEMNLYTIGIYNKAYLTASIKPIKLILPNKDEYLFPYQNDEGLYNKIIKEISSKFGINSTDIQIFDGINTVDKFYNFGFNLDHELKTECMVPLKIKNDEIIVPSSNTIEQINGVIHQKYPKDGNVILECDSEICNEQEYLFNYWTQGSIEVSFDKEINMKSETKRPASPRRRSTNKYNEQKTAKGEEIIREFEIIFHSQSKNHLIDISTELWQLKQIISKLFDDINGKPIDIYIKTSKGRSKLKKSSPLTIYSSENPNIITKLYVEEEKKKKSNFVYRFISDEQDIPDNDSIFKRYEANYSTTISDMKSHLVSRIFPNFDLKNPNITSIVHVEDDKYPDDAYLTYCFNPEKEILLRFECNQYQFVLPEGSTESKIFPVTAVVQDAISYYTSKYSRSIQLYLGEQNINSSCKTLVSQLLDPDSIVHVIPEYSIKLPNGLSVCEPFNQTVKSILEKYRRKHGQEISLYFDNRLLDSEENKTLLNLNLQREGRLFLSSSIYLEFLYYRKKEIKNYTFPKQNYTFLNIKKRIFSDFSLNNDSYFYFDDEVIDDAEIIDHFNQKTVLIVQRVKIDVITPKSSGKRTISIKTLFDNSTLLDLMKTGEMELYKNYDILYKGEVIDKEFSFANHKSPIRLELINKDSSSNTSPVHKRSSSPKHQSPKKTPRKEKHKNDDSGIYSPNTSLDTTLLSFGTSSPMKISSPLIRKMGKNSVFLVLSEDNIIEFGESDFSLTLNDIKEKYFKEYHDAYFYYNEGEESFRIPKNDNLGIYKGKTIFVRMINKIMIKMHGEKSKLLVKTNRKISDIVEMKFKEIIGNDKYEIWGKDTKIDNDELVGFHPNEFCYYIRCEKEYQFKLYDRSMIVLKEPQYYFINDAMHYFQENYSKDVVFVYDNGSRITDLDFTLYAVSKNGTKPIEVLKTYFINLDNNIIEKYLYDDQTVNDVIIELTKKIEQDDHCANVNSSFKLHVYAGEKLLNKNFQVGKLETNHLEIKMEIKIKFNISKNGQIRNIEKYRRSDQTVGDYIGKIEKETNAKIRAEVNGIDLDMNMKFIEIFQKVLTVDLIFPVISCHFLYNGIEKTFGISPGSKLGKIIEKVFEEYGLKDDNNIQYLLGDDILTLDTRIKPDLCKEPIILSHKVDSMISQENTEINDISTRTLVNEDLPIESPQSLDGQNNVKSPIIDENELSPQIEKEVVLEDEPKIIKSETEDNKIVETPSIIEKSIEQSKRTLDMKIEKEVIFENEPRVIKSEAEDDKIVEIHNINERTIDDQRKELSLKIESEIIFEDKPRIEKSENTENVDNNKIVETPNSNERTIDHSKRTLEVKFDSEIFFEKVHDEDKSEHKSALSIGDCVLGAEIELKYPKLSIIQYENQYIDIPTKEINITPSQPDKVEAHKFVAYLCEPISISSSKKELTMYYSDKLEIDSTEKMETNSIHEYQPKCEIASIQEFSFIEDVLDNPIEKSAPIISIDHLDTETQIDVIEKEKAKLIESPIYNQEFLYEKPESMFSDVSEIIVINPQKPKIEISENLNAFDNNYQSPVLNVSDSSSFCNSCAQPSFHGDNQVIFSNQGFKEIEATNREIKIVTVPKTKIIDGRSYHFAFNDTSVEYILSLDATVLDAKNKIASEYFKEDCVNFIKLEIDNANLNDNFKLDSIEKDKTISIKRFFKFTIDEKEIKLIDYSTNLTFEDFTSEYIKRPVVIYDKIGQKMDSKDKVFENGSEYKVKYEYSFQFHDNQPRKLALLGNTKVLEIIQILNYQENISLIYNDKELDCDATIESILMNPNDIIKINIKNLEFTLNFGNETKQEVFNINDTISNLISNLRLHKDRIIIKKKHGNIPSYKIDISQDGITLLPSTRFIDLDPKKPISIKLLPPPLKIIFENQVIYHYIKNEETVESIINFLGGNLEIKHNGRQLEPNDALMNVLNPSKKDYEITAERIPLYTEIEFNDTDIKDMPIKEFIKHFKYVDDTEEIKFDENEGDVSDVRIEVKDNDRNPIQFLINVNSIDRPIIIVYKPPMFQIGDSNHQFRFSYDQRVGEIQKYACNVLHKDVDIYKDGQKLDPNSLIGDVYEKQQEKFIVGYRDSTQLIYHFYSDSSIINLILTKSETVCEAKAKLSAFSDELRGGKTRIQLYYISENGEHHFLNNDERLINIFKTPEERITPIYIKLLPKQPTKVIQQLHVKEPEYESMIAKNTEPVCKTYTFEIPPNSFNSKDNRIHVKKVRFDDNTTVSEVKKLITSITRLNGYELAITNNNKNSILDALDDLIYKYVDENDVISIIRPKLKENQVEIYFDDHEEIIDLNELNEKLDSNDFLYEGKKCSLVSNVRNEIKGKTIYVLSKEGIDEDVLTKTSTNLTLPSSIEKGIQFENINLSKQIISLPYQIDEVVLRDCRNHLAGKLNQNIAKIHIFTTNEKKEVDYELSTDYYDSFYFYFSIDEENTDNITIDL